MAVDLTTLEKYNLLSEVDKDLLRTLCVGSPEDALLDEERRLKLFKSYKFGLVAILVLVSLGLTAYDMGLPSSIWTFVGGIFLFFFTGLMLIFFSMLIAEMIFLLLSKILIESTKRHKFMLAVNKKWNEMDRRRQSEIDQARCAAQRVAEEYQKDVDALVEHKAQGKSLLVPKSLFKFSSEELLEFAISRCSMICEQKNLTEQKRNEVVHYYRNVSSFLAYIADDEVVELEETLMRINGLMQDKNIQDSIRSDLLHEYARVSQSQALLSFREFRKNCRYFERFEEVFPSPSEKS